jgi:hypothetical protein
VGTRGDRNIYVVLTLWSLGKSALPTVAVATLIPLALFYGALAAGSMGWAIAISIAYAYAVSAYQYRKRGRISGLLLVTLFMATIRAGAAACGQTGFYFAVPIVETAGFGLMFVATMFTGEPLVVHLARDLVPHAADHIASRRTLIRTLSLIWTATYLASGATTLLLLTTVPVPIYVGAHTLTGWFWTGSGILGSILACRRWAAGIFTRGCLLGENGLNALTSL